MPEDIVEDLISPPDNQPTPIDPKPGADTVLEELKHSIRIHLTIMGGPTPQLAVFLVKIIDFIEDKDTQRRRNEMARLAFAIVEATALHIQQSIDARAVKDKHFPNAVLNKSDGLLIIVGKSRGLADKIIAKNAVLKEIADALRVLSTYTKSQYPTITTADGNAI